MTVADHLEARGPVARRRDLLAAGFSDAQIRAALRAGRIFRVRHGWYARPHTADPVVRAIRIGGRVTGVEALRMRGLFLPRPARVDIAVPRNAAALRSPRSAKRRLGARDAVRIHWTSPPRNRTPSRVWIESEDDALAVILRTGSRELAVAACDGLIRYRNWTSERLDAAFARAPASRRPWRMLVDGGADSWGETAVRLRLADCGITFEPQWVVPGAGRFDGRVSRGVAVEIDGAQHDEAWSGDTGSSFERDHLKDLALARVGGRCIRITYPMFVERWPECLDAIRVAIAQDARLHGAPRRVRSTKLRRSDASGAIPAPRRASTARSP